MSKTLCIISPVKTISGYGVHSRMIIKSLLSIPKITENFEISLISTKWGSTPQTALKSDDPEDAKILDLILPNNVLTFEPDVLIQISIPSEFKRFGKKFIGISAGTEASLSPIPFIHGVNATDLTIVPSNFTKDVLVQTIVEERNNATQQVVKSIKVDKPVEVLFEGIDTDVFDKSKIVPTKQLSEFLNGVKEDWCYLTVGHWINASLGNDRKDVGMLIHTFIRTFLNKKNRPALILKVSGAGFSIIERNEIIERINLIQQMFRDEGFSGKLPSIYLLNGELTPEEMNQLMNHPKVKAFVSFTHAEGYGLPFVEFATTGKPLIVTNYSGHLDFIKPEHSVLLPGKLVQIDPSAANEWLPKEGEWFRVDYNFAGQILRDVFENYGKYLEKSRKQPKFIRDNFSLEAMKVQLLELFEKYELFQDEPKMMKINLPKLKKLN